MTRTEHVVSRFPIEQLWAGTRLISTLRMRDLEHSDVAALLRSGNVRFVIAELGKPLTWISNNESADFWRDELEPHLGAAGLNEPFTNAADTYHYVASEWKSYDGDTIVLLSKMH